MDKQQIIEDVGKYIDKYYVPGNDDIEVEDAQVKGFFDKITDFIASKKEKSERRFYSEDTDENTKSQEDEAASYKECAEDAAIEIPHADFDISSAKMTTITKPMSQAIVGNRKIDDLMSQMDETFSQRLIRMIKERNMSESEAYKKAYVDRRHFSKIKKDEYYAPNKKTVLAFAIALELNLDEAKDLLRSAGYALSRSSKFDIIIVYFLQNKIYDMFEINDVLYEYGQPIFE